jgi:transcriptional regulator with XRE-family HTH domain
MSGSASFQSVRKRNHLLKLGDGLLSLPGLQVSLSSLAVHTGLGRPFISNVENGRKEPCLRSLEILAIAFDISLAQLMSRL